MATLNYLAFPVTPSIMTTYNVAGNEGVFRTSPADQMVIFVAPDALETTLEDVGTSGVTAGYRNTIANISQCIYGFSLTIPDGREVYWRVLNQLHKNAMTAPGEYAGVECWDYVRVEDEDVTQGYTIRQLLYLGTPANSTTARSSNVGNPRLAISGWTATFQDLALRY